MKLKEFNNFSLVGGTALALKFGHRISVDLDFFSNKDFDIENITKALQTEFTSNFLIESKNLKWGLFCFIEDIKVDIIHYKHPTIYQPDTIENIRIYSTPDIAAMKINAILGRGKKNYFWDLLELLQHYKLAELISFYNKKYASQNLLITIPQAITYFDDAEDSEEPVSLKNQTWDSVKKAIQKSVREYLS